jgi:intracellular sulfur oxidation DsrE/DsrF family protein
MDGNKLGRSRFLLGTPLLVAAATGAAAASPMSTSGHRLVMSVSENDAAVMNLALNNAANASVYFDGQGQQLEVEIVAYGPGLNMFREDTSPVKARLQDFKSGMPNVTFSACGNTLKAMEKAEGKTIAVVPEAHVVPAGVVRLIELEEQGWSYVKP